MRKELERVLLREKRERERERERERGGYVVEEVNEQKEKYCSRIQHFYLYKLKA